MTLEEIIKFVEAKESGKSSASCLLESQMHGAAAAIVVLITETQRRS